MKSILFLLSITLLISSCSKSAVQLHSSQKLPASPNLKSYALVLDESVPNSIELQRKLHKEMARKNYFYDPQSPDMLVMGSFYHNKIEILSGSKFINSQKEIQLETSRKKTKKNTLLIQLVDANTYAMVWRGFSSSNTLHLEPFQLSYSAGRLLND
jgi:hypothetical protein